MIGILGRIAAGVVLLAAAGMAVLMGVADVYAQRSTTEGLARAVELRPGNADYHRWLGITLLLKDRKRAEGEFREAVRLNAWDADSRMRLALMHEAEGKVAEAERELEEAAKVDATFLPRWALANFELRHERTPEFWKWARAAVPMSYGDRSPLFDLAAATGETNLGERLGLEKVSLGELPGMGDGKGSGGGDSGSGDARGTRPPSGRGGADAGLRPVAGSRMGGSGAGGLERGGEGGGYAGGRGGSGEGDESGVWGGPGGVGVRLGGEQAGAGVRGSGESAGRAADSLYGRPMRAVRGVDAADRGVAGGGVSGPGDVSDD